MSKAEMIKKEKAQLSVWLPSTFMADFNKFVEGENKMNKDVYKITNKVIVHRALVEYMSSHRKD